MLASVRAVFPKHFIFLQVVKPNYNIGSLFTVDEETLLKKRPKFSIKNRKRIVLKRTLGYVDDFCIWKEDRDDNLRKFMHFLNHLDENINFTKEEETDNTLNFLDIKIMKKDGKLKFGIYRKATHIDTVIKKKFTTSSHTKNCSI